MNLYAEWAEAFTIFESYVDMNAGVSAHHDIVYAGPSPSRVSQEDQERLAKLGWRPDEEGDCFYKFT